ncbi:hypothetical protein [Streptomyces chattanoogensis]|uniref:hypothetical protein n=1 Tax=Streptomyces chattanoogensis TaxID=66876 RepID=UPI00367927E0
MAEQALASTPDAMVRLASLRGVDVAHLILADVDLSGCLLTGTVHLDQLRLEGTCSFDEVPPGTHWRRWRPVRHTQRRTLAEEHHLRANQSTAVPGWNVAVFGAGHVGPAQLAPVYRALRKESEDGKNQPGAADFYYGEMEMRRHDCNSTIRAERGLLHGYCLLAAVRLRPARLPSPGLARCRHARRHPAAHRLRTAPGLPGAASNRHRAPGGGTVTFHIQKDDPRLKRHRAVATRYDRLAGRCEAAVRVATINEWL